MQPGEYECRVNKKFGCLIPHERREICHLRSDLMSNLYVAAHPEWDRLKTPESFIVPLPSVVAYQTAESARTYGTACWEVLYTNWAAQVACACIWEIYSSCRIWYISKLVFQMIQVIWPEKYNPISDVKYIFFLQK